MLDAMTRRTARPTLRVVREDLDDDHEWGNLYPKRAVESDDPQRALPLTELDHPILLKAADCFGEDPLRDNPVGTIAAARSERLYEIKVNQWRAGVWIDGRGVCWVVAAGLAKGNHKDRDDFYQAIERRESRADLAALLPTDADVELWKLESAHALLDRWHLENQKVVTDVIASVARGGSHRFAIAAPERAIENGRGAILAEIDIVVARFDEPGYRADEIVVTIHEQTDWKGSRFAATFALSLLATLNPPETDWDVAGGSYSNILEIGTLERRVTRLREMNDSGERAVPEMVSQSHYVHRRDLTSRMVEARAARALCGIYFVPRQDHEHLPECPECSAAFAEAAQ